MDVGGDSSPRRLLGRGVLEHLAPEIADEAEYQRLLAEERQAHAATRLSFKPRGDGSTDIHARLPDHVASRLRTYLESFTSPRRTPLGDVDALPVARCRGEAFCALLENLPDTGLPTHGGSATSVMVTLDLDTLISGLGVADTSTGDRLTAEQARRLACQARINPSPDSPPGRALLDDAAGRPADPGRRDPSPAQRPSTTTAPTSPAGRPTTTPTARPALSGARDGVQLTRPRRAEPLE